MERDHAFITDKADLRNTCVGSKREICLLPRWRRKGGLLTCGCEVPAQLRKDESENQKGAGFSLKSRPATRKSPRHGVTQRCLPDSGCALPCDGPPGEADEDSDFFSLESVPLLARALAILRVCVVGQWRICGTSVTRWSKSYSNFFSSSPKHILLFPLPILEIESLKWRGRKAFLKSSS